MSVVGGGGGGATWSWPVAGAVVWNLNNSAAGLTLM